MRGRGPVPSHRPQFPSEFLAHASDIVVQRAARHDLRQRASLVLLLHEQPFVSSVEAARQVQLHPTSVVRWRRRWAQGDFSLVDQKGRGRKPHFPPKDQAAVKALACELVHETKQPLSRQSLGVVTARACLALERPISRSTVARILSRDAIKPWRYKYWIFPRDPQFAEKAGRVLDLYAGLWAGQPLNAADEIISADEKTSIQARSRCHPALATAAGRPLRVENEYARGGALQYLAGWDVRRGRIMGRCEEKTGIEPFGRLVAQVMNLEPYRSAPRVFWVVDNGSSHRGAIAAWRLQQSYPNLILVHTPVHASWLNQVEIYFSILQRKVLTPNDFDNLDAVEQRIMLYEVLTNQEPHPFDWKFTRAKLIEFLGRLEAKQGKLG